METFSLYLCKIDPETSAVEACLGTLICGEQGYKFRPWSAAHGGSRRWHSDMFAAIPRRFNQPKDFTRLLDKAEFSVSQGAA